MDQTTEQLNNLLPFAVPLAFALLAAAIILAVLRRIKLRIIARRPQQVREICLVSAIVRNIALLIILLTMLEVMEIPLGNLWTAISTVIALVAIGFFAVWSVLSHMTASVVLFFQRPFRHGEFLQLADDSYSGKVIKTGLFYTEVEDAEGGKSHIPNNILFQRRFRVTVERPEGLD